MRAMLRNETSIAIYLSDVNSGDIGSLASGPLWISNENKGEVDRIVEHYKLIEKIPHSINQVLITLPAQSAEENCLRGSEIHQILLLENDHAIATASAIAQEMGYRVETVDDQVEGSYREIADTLIAKIIHLLDAYPNERLCLISGGEASCMVRGQGIGGRNQEFVLYSAIKLEELALEAEVAILSCGTDGIDGISPATGAVVDSRTIPIAKEKGLDIEMFLQRNDSHSLLKLTGGVLLTGPSGTNIRDIRILLAKSKSS